MAERFSAYVELAQSQIRAELRDLVRQRLQDSTP
jgi:hypothetical protein